MVTSIILSYIDTLNTTTFLSLIFIFRNVKWPTNEVFY